MIFHDLKKLTQIPLVTKMFSVSDKNIKNSSKMDKNGWNSNINVSTKVYEHFLSNYHFKLKKNKNLTKKTPNVSKN